MIGALIYKVIDLWMLSSCPVVLSDGVPLPQAEFYKGILYFCAYWFTLFIDAVKSKDDNSIYSIQIIKLCQRRINPAD